MQHRRQLRTWQPPPVAALRPQAQPRTPQQQMQAQTRRAAQSQRYGEILMALRCRRVYSVAIFHLPPPGRAELQGRFQAGPLSRIGRLFGPGLVERFEAVVVPHRPGQMEAAFNLQLAGLDRVAGGDQRLGELRLAVGRDCGRRVGGSGHRGGRRGRRPEPNRQMDPGVGLEQPGGPVGKRLDAK